MYIYVSKLILLIFFILTSSIYAHDKKKKSLSSHEHGLGTLNLSQDKNILLIEFEAPGNDIVGFEYVPKVEEDVKKVEEALKVLSNYKNIILPSSSGRCSLIDNSSTVSYEGTHSEFLTNYKFNCNNMSDLKIIYLKYFKIFPNFNKTNIKIFGMKKKSAYVINSNKKILNVKDHF